MLTDTLPMRATHDDEQPGSSLAVALVLHALLFAGIGAWAYIAHERAVRYGDQNPVAGSIQASMVSSLPLPPRKAVDKAVLATEKPSETPRQPPPEPTPPKALATPKPPPATTQPNPDAVAILNKPPPKTLAKPAEVPQPVAPKRPATPPPPTPKATTGESAALQIPAATKELRNGTASITIQEQAFGNRYPYYISQISKKIAESWSEQQISDGAAKGKKATVTFTIDRDGDPIDAHVTTISGSGALDQAALRTIQRIDTFGPLPAGSNIVIAFTFDFHPQ